MTKTEACKNRKQDQQDDLSKTFQKLTLSTINAEVNNMAMQIQRVCFEADEEQSSISFSHLHEKIFKIKNKIEKGGRKPSYCSKCHKNFVPKGYKNCIKCCFGNSLSQYLKNS